MIRSLPRNYKALITGGIITIFLTIMLIGSGLVILDPDFVSFPIHILINILSFIFCWLVFSFLIHKYSLYQVLGLIGLLLATVIAERYIDVGKNPFTIPLLILFWLGISYLLLPQFFEKYKVPIISVYGFVIFYHLFVFITTPDYAVDHRSNLANFMLVPIPVFAVLWGYEQWRWLKILQADKGKAELALLKSQINPHFFFNTLNNLYGLVVEKSEKAPEVVLKLSDMMRYTIYEGKEEMVLLKDEISYLENYIELHKIRYQKKVEIIFTHDVEEGLKVAPLLFIILLENAFKHGVDKMRAHAFIHLHLQAHGNQLLFTIENNFDEIASEESHGIGLENLKKRLAYSYPNRHELKIEQETSIFNVQLNLEL